MVKEHVKEDGAFFAVLEIHHYLLLDNKGLYLLADGEKRGMAELGSNSNGKTWSLFFHSYLIVSNLAALNRIFLK
jgi:hypothetical protein